MSDQKTHWKRLENPNYIGVYAFNPGEKKIVTIKAIKREMVHDEKGGEQEKSIAYFFEDIKPMVLNKTNQKTIEKMYKTPYIEEWAGKKIQLYIKKEKAFGEFTDVLRISPVPPKSAEQTAPPVLVPCADCKANIVSVNGVPVETIVSGTQKSYGRPLCMACANAAKQKAAEQEVQEAKPDDIE